MFNQYHFVRRLFNNNTLKFDNNLEWGNFPISRCIPNNGHNIKYFDNLIDQVPNNNFLMGIQYKNTFDVQIGCSGTLKQNETFYECACRELEEELGISANPICINNSITNSFYLLDINNAKPVDLNLKEKKGKDIKKSKSWIIIHGDEHNIIQFMNNLISVRKSNDYPFAVTAFKKEYAINWIKYIRLTTTNKNLLIPINPRIGKLETEIIKKISLKCFKIKNQNSKNHKYYEKKYLSITIIKNKQTIFSIASK